MSAVEEVAVPWKGVVLVCRKCSRKLKGGFGRKGKQDLARGLRETLKATGRRRVLRVLEVDCLGLCPKRAVTLVAGSGRVFVVPAKAELTDVLEAAAPELLRAPAPLTPA